MPDNDGERSVRCGTWHRLNVLMSLGSLFGSLFGPLSSAGLCVAGGVFLELVGRSNEHGPKSVRELCGVSWYLWWCNFQYPGYRSNFQKAGLDHLGRRRRSTGSLFVCCFCVFFCMVDLQYRIRSILTVFRCFDVSMFMFVHVSMYVSMFVSMYVSMFPCFSVLTGMASSLSRWGQSEE